MNMCVIIFAMVMLLRDTVAYKIFMICDEGFWALWSNNYNYEFYACTTLDLLVILDL
jgi:hypothetical protein